jgi:hypothetical protein
VTKLKKSFMFFCFLLWSIILVIGWLWVVSKNKNPYRNQQENLANDFGVRINDYPYEMNFPLGYFYAVLKPGMSIDEIHKLTRGYEKVDRCRTSITGPFYKEVYYYYSSDDLQALRFQMFYDNKEVFTNFQSEDNNSRTISTKDCELGLIGN